MFKARFEEPINSAKQLIENNITLFMGPGYDFWVHFLADSPVPEYQTLSKRMIIPDVWSEYDKLIEHGIIGNGTHARMSYGLNSWEMVERKPCAGRLSICRVSFRQKVAS